MKAKREREEPCFICSHYHDYEGGEPCSVCGHRLVNAEEKLQVASAFPSEIVQDFLYLGSYDNASRSELLKAIGMRYILNCVPTCQVLYRNSFTYHTVSSVPPPFAECIDFIELARKENAKILVHCMSGISRSPSVVIAYLMKLRNWRLADSVKWVKERRQCVEVNAEALQQLIEMEVELFGSASVTPDGKLMPSALDSLPAVLLQLVPDAPALPNPEGPAAPWSGNIFQPQAPQTSPGGGPMFGFGPSGPQNPGLQQQFTFGGGTQGAGNGSSFVFGGHGPSNRAEGTMDE